MKKAIIISFLLLSFLLAACAGGTETPTTAPVEIQPTEEPEVEEVEETPETVSVETMEGTLPDDLVAQLDAYLQTQVYSEGGYPKGAAPGLVLLVDTPDGRYLEAAGVPAWKTAPLCRWTTSWKSAAIPNR